MYFKSIISKIYCISGHTFINWKRFVKVLNLIGNNYYIEDENLSNHKMVVFTRTETMESICSSLIRSIRMLEFPGMFWIVSASLSRLLFNLVKTEKGEYLDSNQ